MYEVLENGITVFEGSYEECVEYAKENGIMRYTAEYGWMMTTDSAII